MNDDTLHPWIEPELEARLVALVLGEASDFEREELERLVEEQPELSLFLRRMEAVHDLLRESAATDEIPDDGEWRLAPERREKVLALLEGETTGEAEEESRETDAPPVSAAKPRRTSGILAWTRVLLPAAAALVFALLVFSSLPGIQMSSRMREDAEIDEDVPSLTVEGTSGGPQPRSWSRQPTADELRNPEAKKAWETRQKIRGVTAETARASTVAATAAPTDVTASLDSIQSTLDFADESFLSEAKKSGEGEAISGRKIRMTKPDSSPSTGFVNSGRLGPSQDSGALNGTAAIGAGGEVLVDSENGDISLTMPKIPPSAKPPRDTRFAGVGHGGADFDFSIRGHGGVMSGESDENERGGIQPRRSPSDKAGNDGTVIRGRVNIDGNSRTRDELVRRKLASNSPAKDTSGTIQFGAGVSKVEDMEDFITITEAKTNDGAEKMKWGSAPAPVGAGGGVIDFPVPPQGAQREWGDYPGHPATTNLAENLDLGGSPENRKQVTDLAAALAQPLSELSRENAPRPATAPAAAPHPFGGSAQDEAPAPGDDAQAGQGLSNTNEVRRLAESEVALGIQMPRLAYVDVDEDANGIAKPDEGNANALFGRQFRGGGDNLQGWYFREADAKDADGDLGDTRESPAAKLDLAGPDEYGIMLQREPEVREIDGFIAGESAASSSTFASGGIAGKPQSRSDVNVLAKEPVAVSAGSGRAGGAVEFEAMKAKPSPANTSGLTDSEATEMLFEVVPRVVGGGEEKGVRQLNRAEQDGELFPALEKMAQTRGAAKVSRQADDLAVTASDLDGVTPVAGPAPVVSERPVAPDESEGAERFGKLAKNEEASAPGKSESRFHIDASATFGEEEMIEDSPATEENFAFDSKANDRTSRFKSDLLHAGAAISLDFDSDFESEPSNKKISFTASRERARALRLAPPAGLGETSTAEEAFSTFSLHVGDVSFQLARTALAGGEWPDETRIRIEEFVNAFDYGDPLPGPDEKVACRLEQAAHPFLQQRNLLRVAMRTSATGRAEGTPLRLTLLLDNSGSMERADREETVRRALALLAEQLRPGDSATLLSFARQPRLLADTLPGERAGELVDLVANLPSEGGTNLEAALELALEKAREQKADGAQSRIVLLTDGAANLGDAEPESLAGLVTDMREEGIAFDAAGIGAEGLNDEILEALTRQGDGRYYLLDRPEDADEGFARRIAGALRPAAGNVKVQVEFNPDRVTTWKLLGFKKHLLNKEDFRDDTVDAAEMAAEESGVAVYQFEPNPQGSGDVGFVSVRFRDMATGEMVERRWPIPWQSAVPRADQSAPSMQLATAAALLAARLEGGALGETVELEELSRLVAGLPESWGSRDRVRLLRAMIESARTIEGK